jgi:hypothetical protein
VNNTNTIKLDLSTTQTRSSDISSERKRGDVCKEEKIRARAKGLARAEHTSLQRGISFHPKKSAPHEKKTEIPRCSLLRKEIQ